MKISYPQLKGLKSYEELKLEFDVLMSSFEKEAKKCKSGMECKEAEFKFKRGKSKERLNSTS